MLIHKLFSRNDYRTAWEIRATNKNRCFPTYGVMANEIFVGHELQGAKFIVPDLRVDILFMIMYCIKRVYQYSKLIYIESVISVCHVKKKERDIDRYLLTRKKLQK